MSDTNAQEPTMEEILASIRRIISEDDAPAAKAAAPALAAHAGLEAAFPPGPAAKPAPSEEDDVLELTEPLAHHPEPEPIHEPEPEPARFQAPEPPRAPPPPPAYETLGDLDVSPRYESAYSPPPAPDYDEPLVSGHAAGAAASHFGQLSRTLGMPADGRTLEDVVVAVLRPMLKDWLDKYLPSIVEAKVQAEVERISRSNLH
jgi:cell pole-organizing protein PopZ